jgi:dolichyl-phosphate-mannose-protein mannosyltransferase
VAAIGAIAILLDNALLVISRLILPDIFLIVFGIGALCCYLSARTRAGAVRLAFVAASAFLAGCALSVKWTGASALGLVLAAWLLDVVRRRGLHVAREGLLLAGIPALVYLASWDAHFALLSRSGPGDRFMSARFQKQLPGAALYDPAAPRLSFWTKLGEVHHAIRYGNGTLQNVSNVGSSPWYTWPIMKHPIALWEAPAVASGERTMIILLGNPVVWWGALFAALIGVVAWIARRRRFVGADYGVTLLLAGAVANFLPFAMITRVMYLYHYLFALVFVTALAALSCGVLAGWNEPDDTAWHFASRRSAVVYAGVVALIAIGFVYFLPFTYGWTLSAASWDQHFRVLHPF